MGGDFDARKLAITEEYQTTGQGTDGKNYKSIHSELKVKERMKVGSLIYITGGTHKGMEGKVIALSDPKMGLK